MTEYERVRKVIMWARTCAVASVALFVLSLTQLAFRTDGDQLYGIVVLICGPVEFIVAPLLGLPWLANPILVSVWVAILLRAGRFALAGAVVALGLAALFVVNGEIIESESGHTDPVISLNAGYYLWLCAMLAALAGALILLYQNPRAAAERDRQDHYP